MNAFRLLLLLAMTSVSGMAQQAVSRPKLVVGIVVDQMRWDYLYRYYSHYGTGGFKRLLRDGFRCEQAFINYLPSFTAPGHSCVWTGSVPAIHGIAGNEWLEGGKLVYCTDDKTVQPVGGSVRWGQMSPQNLLTTTVGDELKLATNARSRVFGISLKDRSSILPAGHLADGAYWFDDSTGNFSTSTYYQRVLRNVPATAGLETGRLPGWVTQFNRRRLADSILAQDWDLLDDSASYTESTPNNPRYEGVFDRSEAEAIGFSHRAGFFRGTGATAYNAVRKLPLGNWLTLQFAKRCIDAEGLGGGSDPDLLCLSLSATDYAGHQFGPNAVELEDMYRRLDRELARFFRFLDERVGKGQYTVFLTADHGAAHNSLFLTDRGIPAGNVSEAQWLQKLNGSLRPFTNLKRTVLSLENYQVYLNDSVQRAEQIIGIISNELKTYPEVQAVVDLVDGTDLSLLPEPLRTMVVNGHHRGRSGVLQIILKPGYYAGYAPTGTTHGTWNPYDTHIPLLWYGWGIPSGSSQRRVQMTDIAATASALLHIQMPDGCVGTPIPELFENEKGAARE